MEEVEDEDEVEEDLDREGEGRLDLDSLIASAESVLVSFPLSFIGSSMSLLTHRLMT